VEDREVEPDGSLERTVDCEDWELETAELLGKTVDGIEDSAIEDAESLGERTDSVGETIDSAED
jgi:hypothetical protein